MPTRFPSAASWFLLLTSLGLFTYAGYDRYDSTREPPIIVDVADMVVDGAPAGVPRVVEYVVRNGGGDPVRLVGAESC